MYNIIYEVITSWASGCDTGRESALFKDYRSARDCFEEKKANIKSFESGYDSIDEDEDFYCEYENGWYNDYHNSVYIQEKELN